MSVRVRSAKQTDAPSIAKVHVSSWRFGHRDLYPEDLSSSISIDEREAAWRDALADPEPSKIVIVAEDNDAVLGFASSGPDRGPSAEPGTAEIYELFVDPEVIGTGVGAALFRESLSRLKDAGYDTVTLWVIEGNHPARRFYEHQGLRLDGSKKRDTLSDSEAFEVRYRASLNLTSA